MLGRYSPVRRASEGSRNPQGPFQECQQLQKGLAAAQQRNNYLVTPTTKPENSVSLPGKMEYISSPYSFDNALHHESNVTSH